MPTNPFDAQGYWPILTKVWTDETKSTLIGTVDFALRFYQQLQTMQPHQHELTIALSDPAANALQMGHYYEVFIGDDSYVQTYGAQQMRANGYIQTIQRSVDIPGSYEITGASASIRLDDHHSTGNQIFNPHIFSSVIDVLNGVQSPAGSGIYPPGYQGILTGTGRYAVWLDGKAPAATTTAQGSANTTGATVLQVASTSGFKQGNWLQINATTSAVCTGIVDGTHLGIYPALNGTVSAGQTVVDLGYTPVGFGDKSKTQWESALLDMSTIASHYGVLWCDALGSTARSGPIYIGPMNDPSGLTAWGGEPLRQDMLANHGITLDEVNAGFAQQFGYCQVDSIQYTEDFQHVKNLYWLTGKGSPDHGGIVLDSLVGGPPFTGTSGSPSSPINGWTKYQPDTGGRLFFVKACSRVTYDGSTYEFIATQRMGSAASSAPVFQYGVIDRGPSVGTNNAPPFDVCEDFLHVRTITSPDWLLSAGIGHLMWNSRPVPSYEVALRHPLTAGAVPLLPRPGQKVTLNYTGQVEAIGYDQNLSSPTYGQLISLGMQTLLAYPPTGMASTDPRYAKLQRATEVTEEWTADGQYVQTLSLGRGKWKSHYWADAQAREMESNVHNVDHPVTATFTKKPLWGVQWAFSRGTQGANVGWAYEDQHNKQIVMQPASQVMSDQGTNTAFFSDSHGFMFTFTMGDAASDLWFIFGKPPHESTLMSLAAGRTYAAFLLAGPSSANKTGFYTTSDGLAMTFRGAVHPHGMLTSSRQLQAYQTPLRLHLLNHHNRYEALLTTIDKGAALREEHVATWNDARIQLNTFGAIGFYLAGGSATTSILDVHAHPHHAKVPPKRSVHPAQVHHASPHKKHRRKLNPGTTGHYLMVAQ